jgi:tetratricopeptide (TPR) repeat protein
LGEELAFSNHPAEARREFEQVIKEKPDYALAHFNLGVALVQMGDSAGALLQFEETLRLDPENQTVAGYIEKLHQAKGRN